MNFSFVGQNIYWNYRKDPNYFNKDYSQPSLFCHLALLPPHSFAQFKVFSQYYKEKIHSFAISGFAK